MLDAWAFIHLPKLECEDCATVPEVLGEVKDFLSQARLQAWKVRVLEPAQQSLELVKRVAQSSSYADKISRTDLKLLALAKDLNGTLVTKDRWLRSLAKELGVRCMPR